MQAVSFPAEPQGNPKNTGVGSLSLLQQVFPTQELNWCLLHCRKILYQLSYEGSSNYFLEVKRDKKDTVLLAFLVQFGNIEGHS